jgi:hypothetical protein
MTKGIHDMLGLPRLDEVLEERESIYSTEPEDEYSDDDFPAVPQEHVEEYDLLSSLEDKLRHMEGEDHEKAMDEVYQEMLEHARNIMDLAFNTDERSRRGLMEIGAAMYKNVMDAKNSKRDSQLKLMGLIQSQRRLELDEKKWRSSITDSKGNPVPIPGDTTVSAQIIEEDRNEIIKRLIANRKKEEEDSETENQI